MLNRERFGMSVARQRMFAEALAGWTVKEARQKVARKHPLLFGPTYFPELFPSAFADMHWEIVNMFLTSHRSAVAAPVALGKTTVITKICALYCMFYMDDIHDVLVVSNTSDLAQLWVEDMGTCLLYTSPSPRDRS